MSDRSNQQPLSTTTVTFSDIDLKRGRPPPAPLTLVHHTTRRMFHRILILKDCDSLEKLGERGLIEFP